MNQPTQDPAMSIHIVPPSTAKGRLELQLAMASLHQQGREVGSFAQFFWTIARGLEYPESTLKEAFILCLDDPLPQWEMEQLRGLDYWTFSKYLHIARIGKSLHRQSQPQRPCHPPSHVESNSKPSSFSYVKAETEEEEIR